MVRTSAISLNDRQQDLVDRLIRTGRYDGLQDVVASGLRLLEEREEQAATFIAEIEAEIEIGLASGPSVPMETSASLLADFRKRRQDP